MKKEKPDQTLSEAVLAKDIERVKELLDAGAKPDVDIIVYAIELKAHDVLRALVSSGIDLNHANFRLFTPIDRALHVKDIVSLQILLDAGASLDGDTAHGKPLHKAAVMCLGAAIPVLIAAGASVDARKDDHGHTALMVAARCGYADVVKLLIEAGADQTVVDGKGKNARDVANENGSVDVLALLDVPPKRR